MGLDKASTSADIGWCSTEPKRPLGALFLYTSEAKEKYRRDLTRDELLSIQKGWQEMDRESTAAFIRRADELQRNFEKNNADFKSMGRFKR